MKLLIVCPDWFPYSAGLAQSCYDFCQEAIKHGHEIRIITAKDKNLDPKGLDVHPLPFLFRLGGRSPIIFNLWKKIKHHIEWSDQVILYSYMFEMNSRIVLYRTLGLFDKPLIHMYRGSLEPEVLRYLSLSTKCMKWLWDETAARFLFKNVDKTISNSKPTLSYMKKKYGVTNTVYVPNAYHLKEYKKSTQETKRVIFIGRLVENKGVLLFEKILRALPNDWKLTIVGSGPCEPYIQKLQQKHSNLEVKGRLPPHTFIPLLQDSSLLILPSYAEGSPRVVTEALASGVVPVAFAAGDVPTLLADGAGVSIPIGDAEAFCEALDSLCHNDQKRKKIASKAYQKSKKYDWKAVYPRLEKEILLNPRKL